MGRWSARLPWSPSPPGVQGAPRPGPRPSCSRPTQRHARDVFGEPRRAAGRCRLRLACGQRQAIARPHPPARGYHAPIGLAWLAARRSMRGRRQGRTRPHRSGPGRLTWRPGAAHHDRRGTDGVRCLAPAASVAVTRPLPDAPGSPQGDATERRYRLRELGERHRRDRDDDGNQAWGRLRRPGRRLLDSQQLDALLDAVRRTGRTSALHDRVRAAEALLGASQAGRPSARGTTQGQGEARLVLVRPALPGRLRRDGIYPGR